jgi:hypothetical protein
MKPTISIRKALADEKLPGCTLAGETWHAWRVLLIAALGEQLTNEEREIFTTLTRRQREPLQRVEEFCAVVGRRGGKSRAMAMLAAYVGGLCKHQLVRGETGVVLLIAPDQRQAKIASTTVLLPSISRRSSNNSLAIEVRMCFSSPMASTSRSGQPPSGGCAAQPTSR